MRYRACLAATLLALAGVLVIAGLAAGQPGFGGGDEREAAIDLSPDPAHPGLIRGTTMLACVGDNTDNANNWIEYSWRAAPLEDSTGTNLFNFSVRKTVDDDQCVDLVPCEQNPSEIEQGCESGLDLTNGAPASNWDQLDDCHCINATGRWSVYFVDQDFGVLYNNFTIREPQAFFTDTTIDGELGGNQTVQGFETFDTRLVELSLVGLAMLAWWNGWIMAGAFAWLGAMGTQLTDPGDLNYTLGYAGFTLVLALELIGHKFKPMRKIREVVGRQRAGDD